MKVLIIGANGQIGRKIVRLLSPTNFVRAMVRKAEQMPDLESLGGHPIIGDLEKDFSYAYDEIDAVVFAAGSGGQTGADKTIAVDQFGAIKAIETAKEYGVKRFVLISSLFAGEPEKGPKSLETYLEAKGRADDALITSGLEYTILRPTTLSNDEPTGKVADVTSFGESTVTRADVAAFVTAVLPEEKTFKKIYTFANGDIPIKEYL
ncbi:SDR family oxidoreductase [Listeria kieliensis]|uniref:NAD-dependent dehydratase n=1 Tax=Listeria kieliensis TaxID=1621700 RepID=A0A3D8TL21_9LIST|nr:SDR family oxidoreductase [Listeria kieliensis]RDW99437.1 NAD-dependent dehydratase [Listeria kieliensis]